MWYRLTRFHGSAFSEEDNCPGSHCTQRFGSHFIIIIFVFALTSPRSVRNGTVCLYNYTDGIYVHAIQGNPPYVKLVKIIRSNNLQRATERDEKRTVNSTKPVIYR